jgi:lipopolysaccharide transport system permease protein
MFTASSQLIRDLIKRDIVVRFRGSLLGATWAVVSPLFSLTIYYYVFSFVFKARWEMLRPDGQSVDLPTTPVLFIGLIVFNFFSECLIRAPGLIRENPGYVKKINFPLEILPMVAVFSALFTAGINMILFSFFYIFITGFPTWHAFIFPIIFLPLVMLSLGIVFGLGALCVYLPDLKNIMPPFSMALMFMTPVFYPLGIVPEKLQFYVLLNPLTMVVENLRKILFAQALPSVAVLLSLYGISMLVLVLGFYSFMKLRRGFADVL